MSRSTVFLLVTCALGACNSDDRPRGDGGSPPGGDSGAALGDASVAGSADALVYAHSASTLYGVNPDTFALTPIGPFKWPGSSDEMTDIALDKSGNMVGISYTKVYAIDKMTAKCTALSSINGGSLNGLSFIAADQIDANGAEILVGASSWGDVVKIDPTTGAQTQLGSFGGGWGSSGDIVSVAGATYATANNNIDLYDSLVTVNAKTGVATVVGSTGYGHIWGLGYWKQKLFGFTETQGMVSINVTTGAATSVVGGNSVTWYGAGVTTAAPTTVQ